MVNKNIFIKQNISSTLDKHKVWLIIGISVAVLAIAFLFLYSPIKKAIYGEAIGTECFDECVAGLGDIDGDGVCCEDPDCAGYTWGTGSCPGGGAEVNIEICDNGVDDDADGLIDCEDSGCASDPTCQADCSNCGTDWNNPYQALISCPGEFCNNDYGCECQSDLTKKETICNDNIDNDGNEGVDCADSDCAADPACGTAAQQAAVCGNGIIESGEVCDGTDFGSYTCETYGLTSGTLTCAADCLSITTGNCLSAAICSAGQTLCNGICVDLQTDPNNCGECNSGCGTWTPLCVAGTCVAPICGDGKIEGTELCDDGDSNSGDGCSSTCSIEVGYSCAGEPSICTTIGATSTCTDGIQNGEESDIDCGANCPKCGLGKGCWSNIDCESDFCEGGICGEPSGLPQEICTDGIDNDEDTQIDCADSDCATDPACGTAAQQAAICGNGIIESGEICDSNQFGSYTCETYGLTSGILTCAADCLSITTENCIIPQTPIDTLLDDIKVILQDTSTSTLQKISAIAGKLNSYFAGQ